MTEIANGGYTPLLLIIDSYTLRCLLSFRVNGELWLSNMCVWFCIQFSKDFTYPTGT